MKSTSGKLSRCILFTLTSCSLVAMLNRPAASATDSPPSECAASSYHQFDFWIGDWDVFDIGSPTKVAHARIDSILGGCVLREDYRAVDGHAGQSFTIYEAGRGNWHQTWVTSGGTVLEIEGKLENGEIVLSGRNQKGEIVRGAWKPVNGDVRETAVKSDNGGKTWAPWFDIMFRRSLDGVTRDPSTGATDDDAARDKETVAALDTQYQEAVKRNDAATMNRILADDFVLVTSSGKAYSKAELLDEAKSGRITYEHQEDTDKTVRLWGDTAIVTAKLWEKGTENDKPFEYKLWFSDVYRRTQSGWRYVFAQSAYRPSESIP
jgi:ketosteroid isomerase-like protein